MHFLLTQYQIITIMWAGESEKNIIRKPEE